MHSITEFIEHLKYGRRLSQHTALAYHTDLRQFCQFIKENYEIEQIAEVSHHQVRAWLIALKEADLEVKTIKRKIVCLKTYYAFLQKKQLITHNPMLKVSSPRLPKRLPSVVQEKQMEQLFTYVDFGTDYSGHRNHIIVELLYSTGIRRQELIQIQLQDLDLARGQLRVLGKGNKQRFVPLLQDLNAKLKAYLQVRASSFPNIESQALLLTKQGLPLYPKLVYEVVHKYLSMVSQAEQRSPHTLRHSFATHLSNGGADLNAIKTLLGHSSLASTQVYVHNEINRLKKVYEQAHPKSKEHLDSDH